ncbi:PREDICTED: alpha-dioxygenase 1-like isoform X3 [Brassica oleracea var. oleracea]|uniref:alpha-dioxygenase 1-like isoform X3 n=1 Tax=Brassica oleracea var. oleracea TaxID=109376 RepID=UPI0006A730BC|nr:PREDICTED: alpha-dioxygenase 1-like isoform X3 [Brassica oleracea var. oleracea]
MEVISSLMSSFLLKFIHKDFHEIYSRMSVFDRMLLLIVHAVDKMVPWHKLPVFLGLAYLGLRRHLHQEYNLINVGQTPVGTRFNPADYPYRTADGKFNDPFNEGVGSESSFIGRNCPPVDQKIKIELVAPKEVANECPLSSFRFFKTKEVPTGFFEIKTGSLNSRTPWWDSSAIYGSNSKAMARVRTYKDGKLKISEETGLLLQDQDGLAISGDIRNSWVGVSALQALFIKEHNAVCDVLKKEYDDLEDEDLYRHARLVTSAVIAKIHTIDWTVELLKTDTLLAGMRTNWYGILGKKFKDSFGHVGSSILGGIVGMKKPQNHGVPYSITEEFTSVYRMHSLLPDQLELRDIDVVPGTNKSLPLIEEVSFGKLLGPKGEQTMSHIGFTKLMVSMGHQASGALELMNYPVWIRDLVPHDPNGYDRPDHIYLAALEIYRDRERNVARYNEFRRSMFTIPIKKWEDLTDDKEAIEALEDVYGGNVEELDLLVGLMAEKKIKGFAISETAFNVFLLMATRRLEADRFFTSDFNEMTYTKKGLEWVNTTESLKDVFDRHYPEMTDRWMNSESAFSVWDSPPVAKNPIPLYLRVPPS